VDLEKYIYVGLNRLIRKLSKVYPMSEKILTETRGIEPISEALKKFCPGYDHLRWWKDFLAKLYEERLVFNCVSHHVCTKPSS
jgi:hypothetical protein